jgi:hypothetical protein
MALDKWTIHNDPNSPPIGNELNGLHIERTGSHYELKEHNVHDPLSTSNAPAPPFEFKKVPIAGRIWNIHVERLAVGADGGGRWELPDGTGAGEDPTDGEYTAQAGAGAGGDDADAASSAYA